MALITPKTDWVETDYINFTDYNRICNNLNWVKDEAIELGFNYPEWAVMTLAEDYSSIPYADMFNTMISNYNQLNDIYPVFEPIEDVFVANGYTITYGTLNTLEQTILLLDTVLSVAKANIPRLAITLGGNNKLKC